MAIRILLLALLVMLLGSIWLGYKKGPFRSLELSLPASSRQALVDFIEIPALHQYRHGAHAYVGEISGLPPCYRIESESTVRESYPEQVKIDLMSLPQDVKGVCEISTSTVKRFKVAFQASPEALVSVYFNGKPATFVVTEASSTTSLEAMVVE